MSESPGRLGVGWCILVGFLAVWAFLGLGQLLDAVEADDGSLSARRLLQAVFLDSFATMVYFLPVAAGGIAIVATVVYFVADRVPRRPA